MSELIWKIKSFFRSLIPIGLIVGMCYGGFHAYQKGWFGRKLTNQISNTVSQLGRSIPFFGSKFATKRLSVTASRHSSPRIGRASRKRQKVHTRRASRHGHRRHRSRR